jgi:NitT/TauT family transport system substrate-binding protein
MGIQLFRALQSTKLRTIGIVCAFLLAIAAPTASYSDQTLDFGKPGQPVHLVVGYQPYYTESWSGVVMRGKKFYEKYLPAGSTVEFQIGLQGAIIVNNMLAGKQDIGYMGDMPAIVATTKESVADIRMVAVLGIGHDQCNILLVRNDAPSFATPTDALKWLTGKTVAVPKGSCADRFAQAAFEKLNVKPDAYLNQNIEVITSGFRSGKLDAAVIWEPTASHIIQEGFAKRAASGYTVGEADSGFLTMRQDLIAERPDVVQGWLKAELDAQRYLGDPKNASDIVAMAVDQTTGFTNKTMASALYGKFPDQNGVKDRMAMPFTFTPEALQLIQNDAAFLHSVHSIDVDKLRTDAIMPQFTQAILKDRHLSPPVGSVVIMSTLPG